MSCAAPTLRYVPIELTQPCQVYKLNNNTNGELVRVVVAQSESIRLCNLQLEKIRELEAKKPSLGGSA